jgi:hypothetical protein
VAIQLGGAQQELATQQDDARELIANPLGNRTGGAQILKGSQSMPLQDHFHPPLSLRRHWHSFHNSWATYLSAQINERLPPGFFAEANVQFAIEIDVATCEDGAAANGNGHAFKGWHPAPPVMTLPFVAATDVVEVNVFREAGGPTLAGVVELVSPANKDRLEHR